MRGWLDLTAAIVEQAVADLDLAISPCRAKRKPDWAFTPEHFREFFDTAEDLFFEMTKPLVVTDKMSVVAFQQIRQSIKLCVQTR